jgi:hypothetical protein
MKFHQVGFAVAVISGATLASLAACSSSSSGGGGSGSSSGATSSGPDGGSGSSSGSTSGSSSGSTSGSSSGAGSSSGGSSGSSSGGGGAIGTGCSYTNAAGNYCYIYSNLTTQAEKNALDTSCTNTYKGTVVSSCPTANEVGCCSYTTGGFGTEVCYYCGPASDLDTACTGSSGGTWTAGGGGPASCTAASDAGTGGD